MPSRILALLLALAASAAAVAQVNLADKVLDELGKARALSPEVKAVAGEASAAFAKGDWKEAIRKHEWLHGKVFVDTGNTAPPPDSRFSSKLDPDAPLQHKAGLGWLHLLNFDYRSADACFRAAMGTGPLDQSMAYGYCSHLRALRHGAVMHDARQVHRSSRLVRDDVRRDDQPLRLMPSRS